jgi:hypothetical protein
LAFNQFGHHGRVEYVSCPEFRHLAGAKKPEQVAIPDQCGKIGPGLVGSVAEYRHYAIRFDFRGEIALKTLQLET